jgi:hypothetical protein
MRGDPGYHPVADNAPDPDWSIDALPDLDIETTPCVARLFSSWRMGLC